MNRTLLMALLATGILGGSVYTVDAREVAVVTLFGKPVETLTEPGLKVRLPWPIHEVVRFDKRAQLLSVEPAEVLTRDKKNLVVEAFLLWRISDPERFLEAVGTEGTGGVVLVGMKIGTMRSIHVLYSEFISTLCWNSRNWTDIGV